MIAVDGGDYFFSKQYQVSQLNNDKELKMFSLFLLLLPSSCPIAAKFEF